MFIVVSARDLMARSNGRRKPHEASQGWTIDGPTNPSIRIALEHEVFDACFTDRCMLYTRAVVERLTRALHMRDLEPTRSNLIVLLIEEPLRLCMGWLNEFISMYVRRKMLLSIS